MGVPVGCQNLEYAPVDGQQCHVKSSPAEVEYQHVLLFLVLVPRLPVLPNPVSDGRGRRFVDDALHGQAGDDASVPSGVALRVVEIGRDGDDCAVDGTAEVPLGVGLELP
mmetsp:Transcript_26485/g.59359  ORF Transcript_26485/g.59359 Transcript_26485/m.59359 type:complete len:110 (-) Transcript_26485:48-377(-)